jgi:hypothetical protein
MLSYKLSIAVLFGMTLHAHASILLTAGPNEGTTPQSWNFADVRLNASGQIISRISAVLQADRYGLHAAADVINDQWPPHPAPVAGIRVDDVVVNSRTGTTPPPGTTTTVRFGGHLEGGMTGKGGGSVQLDLVVPGKTNRHVGISAGNFPVNDFFYTSPFTVTIGQPFTVEAILTIGVSALPGHATVDFGDSFTFDPSSVLQLTEPHLYTVSSVAWGLVDNRLPVASIPGVPEPAGCAFVLLAGVIIWRITKRGTNYDCEPVTEIARPRHRTARLVHR